MSIHQNIKDEIKEAMRNREAVRLSVVRGLVAGFTNELVAKGIKPQEMLSDDDALAVIKRAVKQRKDSIEQFRKGKREDLASAEEAELKMLNHYLPETMSKDEIRAVAEKTKAKLGVVDKSKLGQFIGALMKELKGKADGAMVKEVAEEFLK